MRHRFALMGEGYATVGADPRSAVHGVLWDLALSDVRALDSYEGVGQGLYKKIIQPVFRDSGVSSRALVYVGRAGASPQIRSGYLEGVIAAARVWELPPAYIRELEGLQPGARRVNLTVPTVRAIRSPIAAERDEQGNVKVRPRFTSPLDRGQA